MNTNEETLKAKINLTSGSLRKALRLRMFIPFLFFIPFFFLPFHPFAFAVAIIANRWVASSIESSYPNEFAYFYLKILEMAQEAKKEK